MATQYFKRNLSLNLYREGKILLVCFLLPLKRDKNIWHLQAISSIWRPLSPWGPLDFLSTCLGNDSLIPLFCFRIMLPKEKGHRSHSITISELTRGVVPKLVRQHILLIFNWEYLIQGPQIVAGGSYSSSRSLTNYCRKGDPCQGPKLGSCLTLGNELSEETRVLTKQEILLGKGTRVETSRVREPRRIALPRGS